MCDSIFIQEMLSRRKKFKNYFIFVFIFSANFKSDKNFPPCSGIDAQFYCTLIKIFIKISVIAPSTSRQHRWSRNQQNNLQEKNYKKKIILYSLYNGRDERNFQVPGDRCDPPCWDCICAACWSCQVPNIPSTHCSNCSLCILPVLSYPLRNTLLHSLEACKALQALGPRE